MSGGTTKCLFATAVLACLSTPLVVHAESAVTLYGVVDVGYRYQKTDGEESISGLASGGAGQSRWGVKGTEDLGNGLAATFQLEGGLLVNNGQQTQGRMFGRQATIGLKGGFGEIRLGRQTILSYAWTPAIASPFGLSWANNSIGTTFGYKQGDWGTDGRISNAVLYFSPKWHGLEFGVGYSFAADVQRPGTSNNDRIATAGVRYANGPLRMGATFERLNPSEAGTTELQNAKNLQLAASYDFKVVRLHTGYNEQRDINRSPAPGYIAAGNERDRAYTFGVSAPLGNGRVMATYQNAVLSKVSGYGVGYQYDLSKRTFLYAFFNDVDTRDHDTGRDIGTRQFGMGLQHKF